MNLYDILGIDLSEIVDRWIKSKAEHHAHFVPSEEPFSWKPRGRVVTLDAAIMAAHLMTARMVFGGFRSIADQLLRIADARLFSLLESVAITELVGLIGLNSVVGREIQEIVAIYDANQIEADKERKIRIESLNARRDLYETALAQRRSKRKTRRVLTRHQSRPQRAPNKRWKSRKKSQG